MPSENINGWVESQAQKLSEAQLSAFRRLFAESSSDITEIARIIAQPCIAPLDQSPIYELWGGVADAVDQLTAQNDKLVDLVIELRKLPDGQGVLGPDPWFSDLPLFNNFWTEFVQFQFNDSTEDDDERERNRQAWINQNSFLAKLAARAEGSPALLTQLDRGGEALRQALETTPWDPSTTTYDKDEDRDSITALDAYVPAASVWIDICAEQLLEKASAGGEMAWEYEHTGTNWGSMKGWSKERWLFWRQRFEELSRLEDLKEETRHAANESARKMIAAENAKEKAD